MKKYLVAVLMFTVLTPFSYINANNIDPYTLPYRGWDGNSSVSSVSFNNHTYLFTRPYNDWWSAGEGRGAVINCQQLSTNPVTGNLENPQTLPRVTSDEMGDKNSGTELTTCIYKGKMYVFYEFITPHWYWGHPYRLIKYKTSSDPANGWSTAHNVFDQEIWAGWGKIAGKFIKMTATVMDDKIYLFYHFAKEGETHPICLWIYDGNQWTQGPSWSKEFTFSYISAQKVTMPNGKESIAIVAFHEDFNDCYNYFKIIFFDGHAYSKSSKSYEIPLNRDVNPFKTTVAKDFKRSLSSLCGVTMSGITNNANVLHIFLALYDNEYYPKTKHIVYNLNKGINGDFTRSNDIEASTISTIGFAKVGDKDIQQYISLISSDGKVKTVKSDYYKYKNTIEEDTRTQDSMNKWTLIGVIDGVPPFPHVESSSFESSVSFIVNKDIQSEVSTAYNSTSSSSFVAGYPDFGIGIGPTHSEVFNALHNSSQTYSENITYTFSNLGDKLGEKGYLIFRTPIIKHDMYERFSSDKRTKIADVEYIYVSRAPLLWQSYNLEAPWQGMNSSYKSSDYSKWTTLRAGAGDTELATISAGREGSSSLTAGSTTRTTNSNTTTNESSFDVQLVFFKSTNSNSTQITSQTTSSITNSFTISLSRLPSGIGISQIHIQPHVFFPRKEDGKQNWVPALYKKSNPWCLTWRVSYY